MKLEQITSISGSNIYTRDGRRIAIGNADHKVGDWVWADGMYVFGHNAPVQNIPYIPETTYRFASSSLQMYYVNTNFSRIVKTKPIDPPVSSANLVLHCYNKNAEYFVWMVASNDFYRCIIQNGSMTIADFTSVFRWIPEHIDGYIDSDGVLQWVAESNGYVGDIKTFIFGKYANGALLNTKTYTYNSAKSSANNFLNNLLSQAANSATVITSNEQTTTNVAHSTTSLSMYLGTVLDVSYSNKVVSLLGNINDGEIGYVIDLWGLECYLRIYSAGNYGVGRHYDGVGRDGMTGDESDLSYSTNSDLIIGGNLHRYCKASNCEVIAEQLKPYHDSYTNSLTQNKNILTIVEKTGEGTIVQEDGTVVNVSYLTSTTSTTTCTYDFNTTLTPILTESETVATVNIGNGYVLKQTLASIRDDQTPKHIPSIEHQSSNIYTGNPYIYLTDGAWLSSENKLIGLVNGKLIKISESNVTTTDSSVLGGGIVTKRFA